MTRHLLDEVLDARAAREAAAALLSRAAGPAVERADEKGEQT